MFSTPMNADIALNEKEGQGPATGFTGQSLGTRIRIVEHHWKPTLLPTRYLQHHTLIFNEGNPVPVSWKTDGRWKKYFCNKDSFVALSSPGECEEMQIHQSLNAIVLHIEPAMIDRMFETPVRFQEQRNFDDDFLKDIFLKVNNEWRSGFVFQQMYCESLLLTAAVHLASRYPMNRKKVFAPKGKLSPGQLKTVIDYVHSFVHMDVSLSALASAANLSAYHFARLFRQTVGVSPYQFVLQIKIDYSKKLMQKQKGSLSDVAYTLNFTDQAHFSNAFKKITGVCPRVYLQSSVL
jgi:AraC family transcriptional regulator